MCVCINNLFFQLLQKRFSVFSWYNALVPSVLHQVRTSKGYFTVTNLSVTSNQWPATSTFDPPVCNHVFGKWARLKIVVMVATETKGNEKIKIVFFFDKLFRYWIPQTGFCVVWWGMITQCNLWAVSKCLLEKLENGKDMLRIIKLIINMLRCYNVKKG